MATTHNMKTVQLVKNIQNVIDGRDLPFPITTKIIGGKVVLSITINAHGIVQDQGCIFHIPTDLVLLGGLNEALSKVITKGNSARHLGFEVV